MRRRRVAVTMALSLTLAGCGMGVAQPSPGAQSGPQASGASGAPSADQGQPGGGLASPTKPAGAVQGQGGNAGTPGPAPGAGPGAGQGHGPGAMQQTMGAGGGMRADSEDFVPASQLTMEALKQRKNLWIDCNLSQQRVYIKDGNQVLKVMATSSGLDTNPDNSTPRGTFQIGQRDTWFYNAQEKEGAMYWVSFKGLEFLFHSVPMDQNQQIIQSEADKLGQKASHGCLRLSVPDAKWFYDNIPLGTKVVIHD